MFIGKTPPRQLSPHEPFVLPTLLYLACVLTDFASFLVVFTVSRSLAEQQAAQWYLGMVGAGLSLLAGLGSIGGGLLTHRLGSKPIFLSGASLLLLGILGCGVTPLSSPWLLASYWVLGLGLGVFYPPLIGWLNQGANLHQQSHGVSRTLILFCIAWNVGMMIGQLTAGSIFEWGPQWAMGVGALGACLNLLVAIVATRFVPAFTEVDRGEKHETPAEIAQANQFKRLSWIANVGGMFGGSMIVHLLPGLAVAIGVSADRHGLLLGFWRAVIIGTYLLLHVATFWRYRMSISLLSQLLAAAGMVTMFLAQSEQALVIGLVLLGQAVGFNYFAGLFYSTMGSSQKSRALSAGIHEATLAAGMAVGTILGGTLGTLVNLRVPYLLAAIMILVLAATQAVTWNRWNRQAEQATT